MSAYFTVAFDQMFGLSILDGVDKDCIGIMIMEKKDVAHTTVGCERKASWLICTNHGIEGVKFNSSGADEMVTETGDLGEASGGSGRGGTGGLEVPFDTFLDLPYASHDGWDREREMFANEVTCELWPSGKEPTVNGFAEGRFSWVASSSMQKLGQSYFGWLMVNTVGLVQLEERPEMSVVIGGRDWS